MTERTAEPPTRSHPLPWVILVALLFLGSLFLGWTWLDPIAGFVIAAFAVMEGREAWEGELVEEHHHPRVPPPSDQQIRVLRSVARGGRQRSELRSDPVDGYVATADPS